MMARKEIKLVLSADGTKRLRIMATPRKLFCFEEETYVVEVENNDAFWSPTHVSVSMIRLRLLSGLPF